MTLKNGQIGGRLSGSKSVLAGFWSVIKRLSNVPLPAVLEGQGRVVFYRPMNGLPISILKRSQAPFVYAAFKQLSKITKKQSNVPYATF